MIRTKTHWIQTKDVVSSIVSFSSSPLLFLREIPQISTSLPDKGTNSTKRESQMQSMCITEKPVLPRFPLSFLLLLLEAFCHAVDGTRRKRRNCPQPCFQWCEIVPTNPPQSVAKNQHFQCLDIFSNGSWRVSVYAQKNHP